MRGRRQNNRRNWFATAPVLALLLAGCSNVPALDSVTGLFSRESKSDTPDSESATGAPVRFTLGDRYTFDNPIERWEVVAIKGEKVYWRSDLGERQVTGFNPLLPPRQWFGRDKGKGRRLIRDQEGALFPIKVGATLKFRSTVTTDRPPFGWEHEWTCRVTGEEALQTLGGQFETYIVKCGHESPDLITYRYAPKVGNYLVRRAKSADGKPDSVRNLLSFERADGTVVAGIVANLPGTQAKAPPAASGLPRAVQAPVKVPEQAKKAQKNTAVPQQHAAPRPAPASRSVNPRPGTATAATTVSDAVAALTLTEPKFGGRSKPPRPLPTPVVDRVRADGSLAARPAPVAPVTKSTVPLPAPGPVAAPPVPGKASPANRATRVPPPAPKTVAVPPVPKKVTPARRATRVPPPPVLGPRSASGSAKLAPRGRVPVPPPPVRKAVPAVPAPSVPPPPAIARATVPKPPSVVPPPPVAVKAAPTVPKPPSAVPPPPVAAKRAPVVPKASPVVPSPPSSPGNAVHLASYRSNAAAEQGWAALKTENDDLLGNLKPQIKQVAVEGKGTFYRLYAGPIPSISIADFCRKLNGRGVFCSPAG